MHDYHNRFLYSDAMKIIDSGFSAQARPNGVQSLSVTIALLLLTMMPLSTSARVISRDFYPDLSFIEAATLYDTFYNYIVVDVRSRYEYDLMHIQDAISIPASDSDFSQRIGSLARTSKYPIVLYANDRSDKKAHYAARELLKTGLKTIHVLDAGMSFWDKTYPQTISYSRSMQPRILDTEIAQHTLHITSFNQQYSRLEGQLVDISDYSQSSFPGKNTLKLSLDDNRKFKRIIANAVKNEQALFFADDTGLQYQWLIYSLKAAGLQQYYFLEGGVQRSNRSLANAFAQ